MRGLFVWRNMKLNTRAQVVARTHEGAPAIPSNAFGQLKRTVTACFLWEDGFYENGVEIATRIKDLVGQCKPEAVCALAIELRTVHHLRHVPLLLMREVARNPRGYKYAVDLAACIQRADELSEFMAIYWAEKKEPLAAQVKKGLALAFRQFNEYELAKYNRDGKIKLRDVLFLCHAKPENAAQEALWKRLVDGKLAIPETWEVLLSSGADKKTAFEGLMRENKLGYMALLRNLRNMQQAGVDEDLVFERLEKGAQTSKALPFRYIAAARAVPAWEKQIDLAMMLAMQDMEKLPGKTVILVDTSPSMNVPMSEKSDLTRKDGAAALAILLRGICEDVRIFAFASKVGEVPPRHGMALSDAIQNTVESNGTLLGNAVRSVALSAPNADRLIVFTDEEPSDVVGAPHCKGYMVNVSTSKNGVGYGKWERINGFSESIVRYIAARELMEDIGDWL